jgi:ADP-ribose pyrophosphatase
MKDDLKWKKISSEHIIRNEWVDVRKERYILPDGRESGDYYNFSRKSYVVILAKDPEGNYICVRQYRPGIDAVTTEFPAGTIEWKGQGRPDEETALQAAMRELKEETGCTSSCWHHLMTVPSWASLCDDYAYIYEADDCRKVSDLKLDESEFLNNVRLREEELQKRIETGRFEQAVHVLAYYASKAGK